MTVTEVPLMTAFNITLLLLLLALSVILSSNAVLLGVSRPRLKSISSFIALGLTLANLLLLTEYKAICAW